MSRGFAVFIIWCALVSSPLAGTAERAFGLRAVIVRELPDVSFHVRAGHAPDAFVRFSDDGRLLALGTLSGQLTVLRVPDGRTVLETEVPEAMVKRVAFSPAGDVLYYGEQGPDGAICALELPQGRRRWCFATARDLGRGEPPPPGDLYGVYHLPGIYRLQVLAGGDLLVLGVHSWFDRGRGLWRRLSRLYRLAPDGRVRWAWPRQGPAPVTMIYADADPEGRRVAAVCLLPSEAPEDLARPGPPPQSFVLLDGEQGRLLFVHRLAPLRPHFDRVSAWESVSVSPRGDLAMLGTADGRLFLFDLERRGLLRVVSLATPITLGGLPVSATLSFGLVGPRGRLYVVSGESTVPFGLPLAVDRPAGPHPAARTLFALDRTGRVLWRFASPFKLQGLAVSRNGETLAVGCAAFRREEQRVRQFGVLVFRLSGKGGGLSRLSGYYPFPGTCFFHLAVSPDGRLVAAVETPWKDELGRLHGRHRLWVLGPAP